MRRPKKLIIPPLIKLKVLLNDTLEVTGIYDSGSNVSLINAKILNFKSNDNANRKKINLKTINGVNQTKGIITVKAKILNIEKEINVFVVNNTNFNHEFLIGLDCIKNFNLKQNEKLEIEQKIPDTAGEIEKTLVNPQMEREKPKVIRNEAEQINFNEYLEVDKLQISINHLDYHQKSVIENIIEK